jgi:D-sedoheptulose 7-phosphate isomerase
MTKTPAEVIQKSLRESIQVKQDLLDHHTELIAYLADLMVKVFRGGGRVILFGNGGSAADAQHIASELIGRFQMDRRGLPAIALTTDTSILTSIGNDYALDQVFARQVAALVEADDLVAGISTSGNSANVLNGVTAAKEKGALTLGFTGQNGGKLKNIVDVCFCVPSENTARIQEAHITVWHTLCEVTEQELFERSMRE